MLTFKHLIAFFLMGFLFLGCKVSERPEFLNIDNLRVTESTAKTITVTADALFFNPNDIGGNLKTDNIKVIFNDSEIATVSTKSFNVPVKDKFTIPLTTVIPKDSIFSNKNLSGLLSGILSNQITLKYKGDIIYKAFGISYTYTLNESQTITIK